MIDLSSSDRVSTASSIRQACLEYGFFYLVNHGIEDETIARVFDQSSKFFALPVEEKMKLKHDENHRGYTPLLAETLDTPLEFKGDKRELLYWPFLWIRGDLNQWPSEEILPFWRKTMECFHEKLLKEKQFIISVSITKSRHGFNKMVISNGFSGIPVWNSSFCFIFRYAGKRIKCHNYGKMCLTLLGLLLLMLVICWKGGLIVYSGQHCIEYN